MQAQDLGLQRARDHRRHPGSRSAVQRAQPGEGRERTPAETAARRSLARRKGKRARLHWDDIVMTGLPRGLDGRSAYCGRQGQRRGTLMRHFIGLTGAPGALACRVMARPTETALVALAGTAQRLAPAQPRTAAGAVEVAAVTAPADLYLLRAARAVVQPMRGFGHPDAPSSSGWTTPCITGIKATRRRSHASRSAEGPGFRPRNCPGLRHLRRGPKHSQSKGRSRARTAERHLCAQTAGGAAPRTPRKTDR